MKLTDSLYAVRHISAPASGNSGGVAPGLEQTSPGARGIYPPQSLAAFHETIQSQRRILMEATGHLRTIDRKSGPVFYAAIRLSDGSRRQRRIGRAWLKRSRPPEGHLTHSQAEAGSRNARGTLGRHRG